MKIIEGAAAAGGGAGDGEERVVEEAPKNEFDRVFQETMNEAEEGETPAKESGAEGGDEAGADGTDTTEKPDGTGKKPPEASEDSAAGAGKKDDAGAAVAAAKPEELTAEDKQFLKGIAFTDADIAEVTPKELARLKRVHGVFDTKLKAEQKRVEFFGGEAKKVSTKYQTIKKAYKEIMGQQTPADRIKGIVSKLDLTKLPKETQELLTDPAYVESTAILLGALGIKPSEIPGLEDDEPVAGADEAAAAAAAGGTGTASAPAKPAMTEAEAEGKLQANIESVKLALKDKHPDVGEVYQDPDFRAWALTISDLEFNKLLSADPQAHDEVLTRYKSERAAKQAEDAEKNKNKNASDGLRTHQSQTTTGTKKAATGDPNEIPDDAEFDKMTASISAHRVRTG